MKYKFSFEKLEVWHLSKDLAIRIYKLTKDFPNYEKYGIISQINRAAISISANIAEGSSRIGDKDQSHFYTIAYSSLMELISHLLISIELGFIKKEDYESLENQLIELANKINALYKFKKSKISVEKRTDTTVQQFNSSTVQQFNSSTIQQGKPCN
jgi:four helix bundle protein